MHIRLTAVLAALPLLILASPAQQTQAQQSHTAAANLQYLNVSDPLFGIPEGTMPFFAGWRGNPSMDRTDGPNLAYHMVSPDGTQSIILSGKPVNTVTSAYAQIAQIRPNTVVDNSPTAAEMLTRYIIPQLQWQGHVSAPEPINNEDARKAQQDAAAQGVYLDLAAVHITGIPNVGDAYVAARTVITSRGQRREMSQTFVRIFTAPAGHVDSLVAAFRALPQGKENPEWAQRQQARDQQGQQQLAAQIQQNQKTSSAIADSNTIINQHHAETQAKINAMRNGTQQTINDRNMTDWQAQQQANADHGEMVNSIYRQDNVGFKWCNANQVVWMVNSENVPAGSGWVRCK